MTKVSIVVPAYNAARTLPKALESLLEQTMADWDCVVVDDGSADTSYNIARAFGERDPRIWAYSLSANFGAANAINVGTLMTSGEYMMALAADDYLLDDFLKRAVAALDDSASAAGVYTDYIEWSEAEGIKRVRRCPNFGRDALLKADFVNFSAFLSRRSILLDPEWDPVADWDFLLRVTADRSLVHVPEVLAVRRLHAGQVSAGLGGPRMMLKRLLLPYRHGGFAPATRAALSRLAGAAWHVTRGRRQDGKFLRAVEDLCQR